MKERLFSRRGLCILLILIFSFCTYAVFLLVKGDEQVLCANYTPPFEYRGSEVLFGENHDRKTSDIAEVKSINVHDGYVKAVIKAKAKGNEQVMFTINAYDSEGNAQRNVVISDIRSGIFNIIYSNQLRQSYIFISLCLFLILVYCVFIFVQTVRRTKFSYDAVFYLSVSILLSLLLMLWACASVYSYINLHTVSSQAVYSVNQNLMTMLTIATLPLMLVYSISVSVSNIVLMIKESFRPANALGIITGALMTAGLGAIFFLYQLCQVKDSVYIRAAYAAASSLYVFFETVLLSAIICGVYASRFTPNPDKDYIIILGCKIRKDGTLYPLIRGRADKAIEFYNMQKEKTGKIACFVPSGGQGSDEIMPEGEAIKNYLIENGIPEDIIFAETQSKTTKENMEFSKKIIDGRTENAKIIFSTTSYHVFRSGIIASMCSMNIEGIGSKTKWYFWPNAFLRETAGLFTRQPKKQILIVVLIALSAGLASWLYTML